MLPPVHAGIAWSQADDDPENNRESEQPRQRDEATLANHDYPIHAAIPCQQDQGLM
jgi:hypothetical protein